MQKHNDSRPTKKQAQKWADALRSGKYKQGKHQLQSDSGHCCMGVACDVFINPKDLVLAYGRIHGSLPSQQPSAPMWLKSAGEMYFRISDEARFEANLEFLNDRHDYTFDMIADIIELEYVHFTE